MSRNAALAMAVIVPATLLVTFLINAFGSRSPEQLSCVHVEPSEEPLSASASEQRRTVLAPLSAPSSLELGRASEATGVDVPKSLEDAPKEELRHPRVSKYAWMKEFEGKYSGYTAGQLDQARKEHQDAWTAAMQRLQEEFLDAGNYIETADPARPHEYRFVRGQRRHTGSVRVERADGSVVYRWVSIPLESISSDLKGMEKELGFLAVRCKQLGLASTATAESGVR